MMGFWKLVKYVKKICLELCSNVSGMNCRIWNVATVSWARLAVLKKEMYSLHLRLQSFSSTMQEAMMASPWWSLARSSSQVIILLLAGPPQAEKTKFILPFMEHPTINLIVIWCLYELDFCWLAYKPDGCSAKISVHSITMHPRDRKVSNARCTNRWHIGCHCSGHLLQLIC